MGANLTTKEQCTPLPLWYMAKKGFTREVEKRTASEGGRKEINTSRDTVGDDLFSYHRMYDDLRCSHPRT